MSGKRWLLLLGAAAVAVAVVVRNLGGDAVELSIKHDKMPAEFFKRYGSVLTQPIAALFA